MANSTRIRVGLITNCYLEERDVIRNSVLFDYFDAVCMSCELGMQKPGIQLFQKCAGDLAVAPEECFYVGDGGSFQLEAAQTVGMLPIQAAWYLKEGVNQPAKRKAESPMDVISEIRRHEGWHI